MATSFIRRIYSAQTEDLQGGTIESTIKRQIVRFVDNIKSDTTNLSGNKGSPGRGVTSYAMHAPFSPTKAEELRLLQA